MAGGLVYKGQSIQENKKKKKLHERIDCPFMIAKNLF